MFAWVDEIIRVGWRKPLTEDDLYDLEPSNTCNVVNPRFVANWDAQAAAASKYKVTSHVTPRLSVLLPLVKTYGGIFLKGSFFALISALLQQVQRVLRVLIIMGFLRRHHQQFIRHVSESDSVRTTDTLFLVPINVTICLTWYLIELISFGNAKFHCRSALIF